MPALDQSGITVAFDSLWILTWKLLTLLCSDNPIFRTKIEQNWRWNHRGWIFEASLAVWWHCLTQEICLNCVNNVT